MATCHLRGPQSFWVEIISFAISLKCYWDEQNHIVVLGPGGIGKSSLASTILNEPKIEAKFSDCRFFVRFDDLLTSQITYSTFVDRVARTLGVTLSNTINHREISAFLRFDDTLIVIDNTETFLDCEAPQEID